MTFVEGIQAAVTLTCLAGAVVSFGCFVVWNNRKLPATRSADRGGLQGADPAKILDAGSGLAKAFREAGPASAAGAISVICLLFAVISSGIMAL